MKFVRVWAQRPCERATLRSRPRLSSACIDAEGRGWKPEEPERGTRETKRERERQLQIGRHGGKDAIWKRRREKNLKWGLEVR